MNRTHCYGIVTRFTLCMLILVAADAPAVEATRDAGPSNAASGFDRLITSDADLGLENAEAIAFDVAWQRPFGSGYSSVVVADGVAISAASRGDQDVLEAFDPTTGETRWRLPMGPVYFGRLGSDDGPVGTPAVADGTVFMVHPEGSVFAARLADGGLIWKRDLVASLDAVVPDYGFSHTPVVEAGVVVVPVGRTDGAMLAGLDTRTGAVRWTAGDDGVGYQNPVLEHFGGKRLVVFAGNENVWGIDPASGDVVWRHALGGSNETGLVVAAGEDRFLYTDAYRLTFLARVENQADGWRVERLWTEPVFRNNHCTPVLADGHFYCFDSRFLSCVRATDGTLLWKSRPPGGQTVSWLDDHLLMWDARGGLTAAEATPAGFRQKGRIQLSTQARVYSPPTFGAGLVLLRDLENLYAVRLTPSSARGETTANEASGPRTAEAPDAITKRVMAWAALEPADRAAAVERFWAENPRMPIVTPEGRVHVFYRGAVEDLAIQGDMTGYWPEVPMTRVDGTDLYRHSFTLPAGERFRYRFKIFEENVIDERNPAREETPNGTFSVIASDEWAAPSFLEPAPPEARGRTIAESVIDPGNERRYEFSVRLPAGYDRHPDRRYPLVIFARGEDAVRFGKVDNMLDRLAGVRFEPTIGVFLELPPAAWYESNRERLVEIMRDLVFPRLEARYRLRRGAEARALVASEWAAENATVLTLALPELIGRLALHSPLSRPAFLPRVVTPRRANHPRLELYIDWATHDGFNPRWPADIRKDAPALAEYWRDAGHDVTTGTRAGGHGWASWRRHLDDMLESFFPPVAESEPSSTN